MYFRVSKWPCPLQVIFVHIGFSWFCNATLSVYTLSVLCFSVSKYFFSRHLSESTFVGRAYHLGLFRIVSHTNWRCLLFIVYDTQRKIISKSNIFHKWFLVFRRNKTKKEKDIRDPIFIHESSISLAQSKVELCAWLEFSLFLCSILLDFGQVEFGSICTGVRPCRMERNRVPANPGSISHLH